ncbi:MAG: winged helix-turn-helix transcriptional regulator [Rhodobacterales bacterium]|nr:winged helix-turn-helix transcriptional regulator [Rhodobacterales bacterium]
MHLSDDEAVEIAEIFRLLGDPTRLRVVVSCLDEPRSVGDIAQSIGATPSLVSHHLRLLKALRLVRADRRGRNVYYQAEDDHVRCVIRDLRDHVGEQRPEED